MRRGGEGNYGVRSDAGGGRCVAAPAGGAAQQEEGLPRSTRGQGALHHPCRKHPGLRPHPADVSGSEFCLYMCPRECGQASTHDRHEIFLRTQTIRRRSAPSSWWRALRSATRSWRPSWSRRSTMRLPPRWWGSSRRWWLITESRPRPSVRTCSRRSKTPGASPSVAPSPSLSRSLPPSLSRKSS